MSSSNTSPQNDRRRRLAHRHARKARQRDDRRHAAHAPVARWLATEGRLLAVEGGRVRNTGPRYAAVVVWLEHATARRLWDEPAGFEPGEEVDFSRGDPAVNVVAVLPLGATADDFVALMERRGWQAGGEVPPDGGERGGEEDGRDDGRAGAAA